MRINKKNGKTGMSIPDEERMTAAVTLLGRTGANEFQLRFSPRDEPPVTWTALGRWDDTWECAAAMNPLYAVFRLCDQVIDGGMCNHCSRPTGFDPEMDNMPMAGIVCWYQYDPELKTFRRGCDGDKK
jgi:hypothetical protein